MTGDRGRTRVVTVLAVLAVALLGVGIGYAVGAGDDDSNEVRAADSDPTSTETTAGDGATDGATDEPGDGTTEEPSVAPPTEVATEGLQGAALELAVAINRAGALTYHAVYRGQHTSETGAGSDVTVEMWRQLPLARRDTTIATTDGTLRTRELRLLDQLLGCIDTSKGDTEPEWICLPSAGKGVDPAEPLLGVARPTDGTVVARDDTVEGLAARCFTVTEADSTVQEVCFDVDGIPVSIDGGDGVIVRTELGRGVDPDTIAVPEGATMRSDEEAA